MFIVLNKKLRLTPRSMVLMSLLMLGTLATQVRLEAQPPSNAATPTPPATPLRQAHAHNDYLHPRPLLDALAHGFTSAEADVFLVDGELLVAHTASELQPQRSLRRLYLEPLAERIEQNQGHVFPGDEQQVFTLLVDIKSDASATYRQLEEELAPYRRWLTRVEDGQTKIGAVEIVVSGNRPREWMLSQRDRIASYDGRISDLGSSASVAFMPLISDRWGALFKWKGVGEMPREESQRLKDLVQQAHREGRRVRFWATPESEAVWRKLREADVDHINTDDLEGLSRFLRETAK